MASVNKVIVDYGEMRRLYVDCQMSIPQASQSLGVSMSTLRARLIECGLLRSRTEAIRLARDQGRLGSGRRGKSVVFTEEWRHNLSQSLRASKGIGARGTSLKPSGYIEITTGANKGRSQHVVVMEASVGRRIRSDEVVHHKDHNRANNELSNLQLMTRSEHSRLHRLENMERKNG